MIKNTTEISHALHLAGYDDCDSAAAFYQLNNFAIEEATETDKNQWNEHIKNMKEFLSRAEHCDFGWHLFGYLSLQAANYFLLEPQDIVTIMQSAPSKLKKELLNLFAKHANNFEREIEIAAALKRHLVITNDNLEAFIKGFGWLDNHDKHISYIREWVGFFHADLSSLKSSDYMRLTNKD